MKSFTPNFAWALSGAAALVLSLGDFAEALTSNVFRYDSTQTGYYTMSPMAFAPENNASADSYGNSPDILQGTGCFVTGVNMPHGARMTTFTTWYASDTAGGVSITLYRVKVADGTIETLATRNSADTSLTRKTLNVTVPAAQALVSNNTYTYSARVCFAATGVNEFNGSRLTYTYNTAGD